MTAIGDILKSGIAPMRRQAKSYASLIKHLTVLRLIVNNTPGSRKRCEYALAHGEKPTAAG